MWLTKEMPLAPCIEENAREEITVKVPLNNAILPTGQMATKLTPGFMYEEIRAKFFN